MSGNESNLSGRTVLIVEDEVLIALDIEAALEDRGAIVRGPITRLSEGLPIAEDRDEAFDCAVLDVNLRGEDVYPIAEKLQARGIPFLFHTGHGDSAVLQERFAGAPVCNKPFQTERLVNELEKLISNGEDAATS